MTGMQFGDGRLTVIGLAKRRNTKCQAFWICKCACGRNIKFYCFCAYNHDAPAQYKYEFWSKDIADLFERIKILMKHGCLPYVMRHENYKKSPFRGMYITIARWCNQPSFLKKMSFRTFCYETEKHGSSSAIRYMQEFEAKYPDIAEKYFDMKWGDDHVVL